MGRLPNKYSITSMLCCGGAFNTHLSVNTNRVIAISLHMSEITKNIIAMNMNQTGVWYESYLSGMVIKFDDKCYLSRYLIMKMCLWRLIIERLVQLNLYH